MSVEFIEPWGNNLAVVNSDKTRDIYIPSVSGRWIPTEAVATTAQGNGGSGAINTGTPTSTPAGSVAAPIDDYPWPNAPQNALSPLRYSFRDCTDFVAWRINRDNGVTSAPWKWTWGNLRYQGPGGNGDAIGWRGDWQLFGWPVDITPVAGCIGWLGSSAGAYGHVYYVQSISGSNMVVEQYNWGGTQAYSTATWPIPAIDSSHSFLKMPS